MLRVENMNKMKTEFCNELLSKGAQCDFISVTCDKSGQGLLEQCEEFKCDMIVIGSRGLGAIKRTLLGSVSDYVSHNASVAVCIVPPPT
ncbi:unnamed protein product [Protopolystoma xenopodis]|uniref:UspA domain-containing protein n=1 Tax=Protopolystoma xenopodis TaxID=117903 RepID=A0A448XJY9_9PLAT|nr:unnamed protein product [Protopolystoma xenopodis]